MPNYVKLSSRVEWWRDTTQVFQAPLKQTSIETTSELFLTSVQVVGTTHEVIAAADVTDDAFLFVTNLSDTATISIGGDSGGYFVEWFFLAPGDPEAFLGRVGALASTYLKSTAASTPIQVRLAKIAS